MKWIAAAMLALGTVAAVPAEEPELWADVVPILQRSCQNCHRAGGGAPMPLVSYEDVRPWARAVKAKVMAREMPPWFIDRRVGITAFKNDPSLTDAEIATIAAWVDAGAPKGSGPDLPPRLVHAEEWTIGEPDLIVTMPVERVIRPGAADWMGNILVDTGLSDDRYIQAVETQPAPGAHAAVHHAIAYLATEGPEGQGDLELLSAYAPGKGADIFAHGAGRLMKAGSTILFNMHYHPAAHEVRDRTRLGVRFYPRGTVPSRLQITSRVGDPAADLDIPPGEREVRHDSYLRLERPTRLVSFQPHMHRRGRSMCLEAILPDMRKQALNCAGFSFGWHLVYTYADHAAPLLPAGTILHLMTWHDNSPWNLMNPDPRNWIGAGGRAVDEMSFAWVNYYELSDADYAKSRAEARTQ